MPSLSSISSSVTDSRRNLSFGSSLASSLGNGKVPSMSWGAVESPVSIQENIALAALNNNSPNQVKDPFWGYPQIELGVCS